MKNQTWYMMNETLKTIEERHSIRLFTEESVTDEDLQTLLEAANAAPSAHNQQSWHFIVIRGEKKRELVELVNRRAMEFPKATSVFLRMASRSIASAPVVVAIANTGALMEHGAKIFQVEPEMAHDFFRTMEIQGSAAAAQNLLLAATSIGLATVWLGALFLLKDEVLQLLGEPAGEFMAVIPVGHPTKETKGPVKQPLEAIVKYLD